MYLIVLYMNIRIDIRVSARAANRVPSRRVEYVSEYIL